VNQILHRLVSGKSQDDSGAGNRHAGSGHFSGLARCFGRHDVVSVILEKMADRANVDQDAHAIPAIGRFHQSGSNPNVGSRESANPVGTVA